MRGCVFGTKYDSSSSGAGEMPKGKAKKAFLFYYCWSFDGGLRLGKKR
jgi:hypothetical protein